MINFSLRQLQYFVATVEHGGVSAAARACHVSQPSVSLAIAQLEAALGSALFRRQASRGVELTSAGQRVLLQARDILGQAAALGAGGASGELRGQLALICFQDLGPYFAPRLLAGFRARHPQVAVTLLEGDLATVQRALRSGKAELALTYELAIDAQMARCTLAELAPYALLPADHPLAAQDKVSLAQLASQPLVLEDIPHTREYLLSLFWQQQLTPRIAQTVQSFEMQRGLVAHGQGVALSCTRPAGDCSYDGRAIACRPLAEALPAQRVVLAQAPGAEASPLVAAFVASALAVG
ncbi:DNA-binding transcriptional LysR family regulator [Vogesella indigofera]|uniref:DNA-binding transcriptional LysR family regulator n=1 Tax=Vogesella indigofera TaxID=45465 RepID=A0A495AW11_VOGIN|nr:LysR family transcriptional regulator [Vogesella indigofera]RKQ52916.1 DNA-binding transcriptional LysR family regulator [Vogesella indigofera]